MNIIDETIEKLRDLDNNMDRIVIDIAEQNEAFIIDANVSQLKDKGITATDISIASYQPYRPKTIEIKLSKGQPTDIVTLRDTGEFHRSFQVIRQSEDSLTIWATDDLTQKLVNKYGEDIFGLNDENLNELIWDYVYNELIKMIQEL